MKLTFILQSFLILKSVNSTDLYNFIGPIILFEIVLVCCVYKEVVSF